MVEMINSLLDIHKFEAGRMVMSFRPEKMQHLVDKLVTQYSTVAVKSGLKLEFMVAAELPQCRLDRATFMRMMGNLLPMRRNSLLKMADYRWVDRVDDVAALTGRVPEGLYTAAVLAPAGHFSASWLRTAA
jgi:hypothetical protein